MPRRSRPPTLSQTQRALALVASAAVALGLAGCSSASGRDAESPGSLLHQASSALTAENALELTGTVTSASGSGTDSVTVDATGNQAGLSQGTLDLEGPGMGFFGPTKFIIIGDATFVDGGTTFWDSLFTDAKSGVALSAESKTLLPLVVNHWIELPAASTRTITGDSLGLVNPYNWIKGSLSLKGNLSNGGSASLNGHSGVVVTSSTGASVIVARSGPALPLAFKAKSKTSGDTFDLNLVTAYPSTATIVAPTGYKQLSTLEAQYASGG